MVLIRLEYHNIYTSYFYKIDISLKRSCISIRWCSQGAKFLKIDLAQFSNQKRFDIRNSKNYYSTTFLGTSYSQSVVAVFRRSRFVHPPNFYYKKTKLRHLNKKWCPGGVQMMHTVVLYCQNIDKDLNNYENKLAAFKKPPIV